MPSGRTLSSVSLSDSFGRIRVKLNGYNVYRPETPGPGPAELVASTCASCSTHNTPLSGANRETFAALRHGPQCAGMAAAAQLASCILKLLVMDARRSRRFTCQSPHVAGRFLCSEASGRGSGLKPPRRGGHHPAHPSNHRCTRAPPPRTSFSTSASVAMEVSPGVVMASAPCAAP